MASAILTTLTPIHIGSGQTLNKNIDFAQEGDKIGLFDLDKIVKLIGIEHIDQLTSVIENSESILDFLRKGRGKREPLEEFSNRICQINYITETTSQLKEHYHTSLKGLCIPGSSLKGSLKTAIWDEVFSDDILRKTNAKGLKNKKGKWSDKSMDKRLFGNTATQKTTRFLKVRDIHFSEINSEIFETIIINQYRNKWGIKNGNRFLLECIPANTQSEFDLILDVKLLNENIKEYPRAFAKVKKKPFEDKESLCKAVNAFTKEILSWDKESLEEEYFDEIREGQEMINQYTDLIEKIEQLNENEFITRIGGNSGWRFTTGGWITKQDLNISDEDYNRIRKSIQKKYYPNSVLLPKTRKTTSAGIPFGFIKVSFNNE